MKTLKFLTIALITSVLFSCTNDNGIAIEAENEFSIGIDNYSTPNAYLIFGNSPNYRDGFMLAFTNAPLIQDNFNGIGAAVSMTQAAVLNVKISTNYFPTEQQIAIANSTYTLDTSNSSIVTHIGGFTNTFMVNSLTYGQPDTSLSNVYEIQTSGGGTVTINSITIDYAARTGTIDCSYIMNDSNNNLIYGNYEGSFEIRNGS